MPGSKAIGTLAAVAALASGMPLGAQDLLDRSRRVGDAPGTVRTSVYPGRDRLDLRVGASFPTATIEDRREARIGLEASFGSDFACGRFDLKANLKSLLTREAREDFLDTLIGAIESELLYNGLVLACEASPTACQAFQHFRVNANALLGIGYDRCQAVESGIRDGLQGAQARSIKDCLDEKEREGKTLDQALEACSRPQGMRGLGGGKVAVFDLGQELEKVLGLPAGEMRDLGTLLSQLRVRPDGVSGEVKAEAVLAEYARLEKAYREAWTRATEAAARNPEAALDAETAAKLQPPDAPGPLPVNVRDIAALPAAERAIYIRWLAGLAALQDLERRVQRIERYLAAATQVPQADEGTVRRMERELAALRMQMRHVDESVRREEAHNQALLEIIRAAEARQRDRASSSLARAKSTEETRRLEEESAPKYGAPRRPAPPPPPGPSGSAAGRGCAKTPCTGEKAAGR